MTQEEQQTDLHNPLHVLHVLQHGPMPALLREAGVIECAKPRREVLQVPVPTKEGGLMAQRLLKSIAKGQDCGS